MATIRVVWKYEGLVVKDETVVNDRAELELVGDEAIIQGHKLQVEFSFDPPLRKPDPAADPTC